MPTMCQALHKLHCGDTEVKKIQFLLLRNSQFIDVDRHGSNGFLQRHKGYNRASTGHNKKTREVPRSFILPLQVSKRR